MQNPAGSMGVALWSGVSSVWPWAIIGRRWFWRVLPGHRSSSGRGDGVLRRRPPRMRWMRESSARRPMAGGACSTGWWRPRNLARGLSSVTALVIDPSDSSRLHAIAHGTVLTSTDAGRSWSSTGFGQTSASALAVDPQNASTLYAISGRVIFKSTDRGAGWTSKTKGLPARRLQIRI